MSDTTCDGNTNIIYITSDCNIACDYCYQKEDRAKNKVKKASKKQIDKFLLDLVKKEPNIVSICVVFGGEPFLEPESVFYLYKKANEITEETGKLYSFCTNTNGIWFTKKKNRERFFKVFSESKNSISLEISFDGRGHVRRNYKNGESTKEDVKKVLLAFKEANVPFHLRYTLHRETLKTYKTDFISLSKFLTYNKKNRIVVSFFRSEIEPILDEPYDTFLQNIKEFSRGVFSKFKVPICELVCGDCKLCSFSDNRANDYTIPSEDDNIIELISEDNAGDFNHFSIKEKNATNTTK